MRGGGKRTRRVLVTATFRRFSSKVSSSRRESSAVKSSVVKRGLDHESPLGLLLLLVPLPSLSLWSSSPSDSNCKLPLSISSSSPICTKLVTNERNEQRKKQIWCENGRRHGVFRNQKIEIYQNCVPRC